MPTKSPNKEVLSISELEEENKFRTDLESKKECGSHKKSTRESQYEMEERDGKPCSARNWCALGYKLLP